MTVPPTRRAGDSQVGEAAVRERAEVVARLNCWIDVRWILLRASADKIGDRARGDIFAVMERCALSWTGGGNAEVAAG
jgi:hypothetical protein